jgi:uncharacterized protein
MRMTDGRSKGSIHSHFHFFFVRSTTKIVKMRRPINTRTPLSVVVLAVLLTMLRLSSGLINSLRTNHRPMRNIINRSMAAFRLQSSRSTSTENDDHQDDDVEAEARSGGSPPTSGGRIEIVETMEWVQRVVIGLNLCPFARQPLREKRLHVRLVDNDDPDRIVSLVQTEMAQLITADAGTTLVVCPTLHPQDFVAFWRVVQKIESDVIDANDWQGIVQVAPFHPQFCFAGSAPDQPDNYTNRSPYPMIHILREADVSKAVDSLPDGDAGLVWSRNVELLNDMAQQLPNDFTTICQGKRCPEQVRQELRRILRSYE